MSDPALLRLLGDHASAHSVPGAAIGVLREGEVASASWGIADVRTREPVTPETRFAVGSLAKSMVATALARLAADGALSLDDPATGHVPELRGSGWAESVTIRDLLANRSRLPLRAALEFSDFEGADDDVLARFAAEVAIGEPMGEFWSYTNAGWCVLGRALEKSTGLTWEEAMRATLLAPLGMNETTFVMLSPAEPRATGHEVTGTGTVPAEPWTPRALGPAGSTLLSTTTDILRFARRHLEDPALAVLRETHEEIRIHGWLDAWCLGQARFDWEGGPVWGWDGLISGERAVLRLLPEQRSAIVVLTNGSTGRAMCRSLLRELTSECFGMSEPALQLEPSPGAAGDLSRFAGVYAWPDRSWTVRATEATLVIEGDGCTVEALPIDDRTFLVDPDDPDNPTVTFGAFDDSGRPAVLYVMLWGLPRV